MRKMEYTVFTSVGQRKNLSPDGDRIHDLPYTGRALYLIKSLYSLE